MYKPRRSSPLTPPHSGGTSPEPNAIDDEASASGSGMGSGSEHDTASSPIEPTTDNEHEHGSGIYDEDDDNDDDEMDFDGKRFQTMRGISPATMTMPIPSFNSSSSSLSSLQKPKQLPQVQPYPYPRPTSISHHAHTHGQSANHHVHSQINSGAPSRVTRARLAPMSSITTTPNTALKSSNNINHNNNGSTPGMPKSQPLSRALFARIANDTPHAGYTGSGGRKKGGSEKLIVPTKGFRTTFELTLTASEFARR